MAQELRQEDMTMSGGTGEAKNDGSMTLSSRSTIDATLGALTIQTPIGDTKETPEMSP